MIDRRTVFEIHRLFHEGYGIRKIARTLKLSRDSVKRYLDQPNPPKPVIVRASKLDPFREEIQRLLEKDPTVSSSVLFQRLIPQGYTGRTSILREYLQEIRPKEKRAYIRFESAPGKQFQVDWGHFGSLLYGKTPRKLYCLAVIEAHSRMLYGEFTHSQKQEALHQALLNAFLFFGGVCSELVVDNMATAVTEREGSLIRFNEAFLEFLRPFRIVPRACHPYQPQEKGKIEKGGIHYIRHNFWPLRSFTDLLDVNQQFRHWLDTQANIRLHNTTGERPKDRFKAGSPATLTGLFTRLPGNPLGQGPGRLRLPLRRQQLLGTPLGRRQTGHRQGRYPDRHRLSPGKGPGHPYPLLGEETTDRAPGPPRSGLETPAPGMAGRGGLPLYLLR